ncbi:LOW QUALITY PROTEIN: 3-oxoacyl-[acyl-carrier-protein] reductase FabG [Polymixia lowei]
MDGVVILMMNMDVSHTVQGLFEVYYLFSVEFPKPDSRCQTKRVVEIGMSTSPFPFHDSLVACELEPYLKEFAPQSPHGKKITVKIGSAMDTLKAAGEQFDMVFIDTDKSNYINYYNYILDHNLLRLHRVICLVNSLFKAKVYLKNTTDETGLALREFNQFVSEQIDDKVFCGVNVCPVQDRMRLDGRINSISIAADISKPEDVQRMIDTIVSKQGAIACNNGRINTSSKKTGLEERDQAFNINLRGTFMCCQAAGRVMLKQAYGKIINTASADGLIVSHPQKQRSYNTSKAGGVKRTQTLRADWTDREVCVNCIIWGIVDTPLIQSESLRPLVQRWLSDIPAGRLAQVTDLQAAVVYLASDVCDYMTGHNLVIEGGQSLW